MTTKSGSRAPIQLDFKSVRKVVVTPQDQDRFVTTEKEAAAACKQLEDWKKWRRVFRDFLEALNTWCTEHASVLSRGYLVIGGDGLRVFAVTRSRDFLFEFADEVSAFDIKLAREFPQCPTEVLQLPEGASESLESFITPNSIQVYGEGSRAPDEN